MYLNTIKTIVFVLGLTLALSSSAIEPQDFCDGHNAAAKEDPALGSCEPCGPKCVRLTDSQIGSHFYKKCPEGGTTCLEPKNCEEDCPECDCEP